MRFAPDMSTVTVNIPVHPKGPYLLNVKRVSGYAGPQKEDEDGKKKESWFVYEGQKLSVGTRVTLELVGKFNSANELVPFADLGFESNKVADNTLWSHNKGSLEMSKKVVMAIMGYDKEEEKEFDAWFAAQDFGIDVDPVEGEDKYTAKLGNGWEQLVGKNVRVQLDSKIDKRNDETVQDFKSWTAIKQK